MLKKVYEFIDYYVRGNEIFQIITFIIGAIIGFSLLFWGVIDSTPATLADYKPLIEQNNTLKEDFNKVYTYDNYEILPSENNIKVTFSNEQCKLACTYDKSFNFINAKDIDSAIPKFGAIFLSFFMGFLLFGVASLYVIGLFLPFILYYLLKFLEWLCLLLVGRR